MAKRDIFREIQKRDAMQFVYAAFFNDRDDVYIKLGRSFTPYHRVKQISVSCPFEIARAVFACVGSVKAAESIEASVRHQLAEHRLRGEWYRFAPDQGKVFGNAMQVIFARVTGRPLRWSIVDIDEVRREIKAGSFSRPRLATAN